jgi:integrase
MDAKSKRFKTSKELDAIKAPGTWKDAGCKNLYLQVAKTGDNPVTKSWLFRFMMDGRARSMGLDSYPLVSLVEAREAAENARRQVRKGVDPIEVRKAGKAAERLETARAVPLKEFAEGYIKAHEPNWRNPKHRQQWRNTLAQYVYPVMGEMPVSEITTDLVLKVIEPEWQTKTETMNRVRGRIEKILEAAKTRGLRTGDNPARWAGHLKELLPARKGRRHVKHHPALPYALAPDFMEELQVHDGVGALALEFTILTASRTAEVIGARWPEFDLGAKIWTVPAERIKGKLQHVVPLTPRTIAIIKKLKGVHKTWVFPGYRDEHLGDNAMLTLLERMGFGHVTVHGMRSMFRTWAGEQTTFSREVAEVCLAHINDDETEAAYLRTEVPGTLYIEKRRKLLLAWARYLDGDTKPLKLMRAAE